MNCSTKFGEVNREYVEFRPEYPDVLFETIFSNTPSPFSTAVDLGAGTGISTKILSGCFEKVYAVEPDVNMTKDIEFSENVTVYNCSGEEFNSVVDDSIQLVTAGNAFYWMNGESVVNSIYGWLVEGGLFVAYRYNFPQAASGVKEIIDYELINHWNEFRSERLIDEEYTYRTINNSGLFSKVELCSVPNVRRMTPETLVGFFTSTSFASAYIKTLGDKENYVKNLIKSIDMEAFDVDFGLELVLAFK